LKLKAESPRQQNNITFSQDDEWATLLEDEFEEAIQEGCSVEVLNGAWSISTHRLSR